MKWPQQFELIRKEFSSLHRQKATNAAIASFFGVSLGKVQAWKRGQRPNADDLEAIARKLGLSPEWLLLGEGEMRRDASYTHKNGMLASKADQADAQLGPVAERVDGIERASKEMELVDLLPFVIKNLRGWYDQEVKALDNGLSLEPSTPLYTHEAPNDRDRPPGNPPKQSSGRKDKSPTRD